MKDKYIDLSSFRFNILEAIIQFSDIINEEPVEINNPRTAEQWWEEFKLYMEDV
jgi:hypothetical protein